MKELNPNKPVQLRDGRQVRNVCWDFLFPDSTVGISAVVRGRESARDRDYQIAWDKYGKYCPGENEPHQHDLINVPEKREGWIHIYKDGSVGILHDSKEIIDQERKTEIKYGCHPPIACIKISFTVGEGLE